MGMSYDEKMKKYNSAKSSKEFFGNNKEYNKEYNKAKYIKNNTTTKEEYSVYLRDYR